MENYFMDTQYSRFLLAKKTKLHSKKDNIHNFDKVCFPNADFIRVERLDTVGHSNDVVAVYNGPSAYVPTKQGCGSGSMCFGRIRFRKFDRIKV